VSSIQREATSSRGIWRRKTATGVVFEARTKFGGKNLRRRLRATTEAAARKERAAWLVDLRRDEPGAQARRGSVTFGQGLEAYLERLRTNGSSPRSVENIEYRARHLRSLRSRTLASIEFEEIQVLADSLGRTMKPSSVKSIMAVGSRVYTLHRNAARHNPFAGIELSGRVASGPRRNVTSEEAYALIDAATPLTKPLVATIVHTGGRISETIGLQWCDVNLEAGTIRIAGQLQDGVKARTKTEAGRRTLRVPESLIELLRAHRARQLQRGAPIEPTSWVFTSTNGKPCDRRRAHRVVQQSARKAGLIGEGETLRPHDLRGAWALSNLRSGMSLADLQRGGGWSTSAMALMYSRIVNGEAVVESLAHARDEQGELVELRKAS
jgi:integrase